MTDHPVIPSKLNRTQSTLPPSIPTFPIYVFPTYGARQDTKISTPAQLSLGFPSFLYSNEQTSHHSLRPIFLTAPPYLPPARALHDYLTYREQNHRLTYAARRSAPAYFRRRLTFHTNCVSMCMHVWTLSLRINVCRWYTLQSLHCRRDLSVRGMQAWLYVSVMLTHCNEVSWRCECAIPGCISNGKITSLS